MVESRRSVLIAGIVLSAALVRFLPHPPNMLPITAMALFAGAKMNSSRSALLLVGTSMLLSDLLLGAHLTMPLVYGSLALVVALGALLRKYEQTPVEAGKLENRTNIEAAIHTKILPVAVAALLSSFLFFVITNFGVWMLQDLYPKNLLGLLACYTAAIPFFENSLVADVFFTTVLFGLFAVLERKSLSHAFVAAK